MDNGRFVSARRGGYKSLDKCPSGLFAEVSDARTVRRRDVVRVVLLFAEPLVFAQSAFSYRTHGAVGAWSIGDGMKTLHGGLKAMDAGQCVFTATKGASTDSSSGGSGRRLVSRSYVPSSINGYTNIE